MDPCRSKNKISLSLSTFIYIYISIYDPRVYPRDLIYHCSEPTCADFGCVLLCTESKIKQTIYSVSHLTPWIEGSWCLILPVLILSPLTLDHESNPHHTQHNQNRSTFPPSPHVTRHTFLPSFRSNRRVTHSRSFWSMIAYTMSI